MFWYERNKKPDMRYISGLINQLLKQVMPLYESNKVSY